MKRRNAILDREDAHRREREDWLRLVIIDSSKSYADSSTARIARSTERRQRRTNTDAITDRWLEKSYRHRPQPALLTRDYLIATRSPSPTNQEDDGLEIRSYTRV